MSNDDRRRRVLELTASAQLFAGGVRQLLEGVLEEMEVERLALSQLHLMQLISRPGRRLKVSDVADFLGVSNAAASRAIDRLVQRDLVDRRLAPDDRRAVDLSLTPRGAELLVDFKERRDAEFQRLLGDVDDHALETATRVLDDLCVRLLDLGEESQERCLGCQLHFRPGCVLRKMLGRDCLVAAEIYGSGKPKAPE